MLLFRHYKTIFNPTLFRIIVDFNRHYGGVAICVGNNTFSLSITTEDKKG